MKETELAVKNCEIPFTDLINLLRNNKVKLMISQVTGNNNKDDKIYYRHILSEIKLLNEFKKREQIKMVNLSYLKVPDFYGN